MRPAKNQNYPCAAVQGLFWASNAAFNAFYVAYLLHQGYTEVQAGWIAMLMYAAAAIAGPLAGYVSDMWVPAKRLTLAIMGISIPAVLLFSQVHSVAAVIAIGLAASALSNIGSGVIDAWFIRVGKTHPDLGYSIPRSMGSLLYAVSAYAVGVAISHLGYGAMFVAYAIFALLTMAGTLWVAPVPCLDKDSEQSVSLGKAFVKLMHCREYVIFIVSVLLSFWGLRLTLVFQPNLVYAAGGNEAIVGACSAIAALFEIPIMVLLQKCKKFSGPLIFAGMTLIVIGKPILILLVPTVPAVILAQLFQAVFSGYIIAFSVKYIQKITPPELYATAVMIYATVQNGLCSMLSAAVGGYLMQAGKAMLLLVAAGFMLAAAMVIGIPSLRDRKKAS